MRSKVTELPELTNPDTLTFTLSALSARSGHQWFRDDTASEIVCRDCRVAIRDADIYEGEGSLQGAMNAALNAIGLCDRVNRVRGHLVGRWHVDL